MLARTDATKDWGNGSVDVSRYLPLMDNSILILFDDTQSRL